MIAPKLDGTSLRLHWGMVVVAVLQLCQSSVARIRGSAHQRLVVKQPVGDAADNSSSTLYDIPLERTQQNWYVAKLQVGGNDVRVAVDTASGDLWVPWTDTPLFDDSSDKLFDGASSKGPSFVVHYGRGAVSGSIVHGEVGVGDIKEQCEFGGAVDLDPWWQKQKTIDGVWGMSCDGGGQFAGFGKMRRLLTCMQQDNKLPRKIVTLQLHDQDGTLTIGGVPSELQSAMVPMMPMSSCDHWQVPIVQFTVGGAGTSLLQLSFSKDFAQDGMWAMLDSGATGIVGPSTAVKEIADEIGAEASDTGAAYGGGIQSYSIPCSQRESLPNVTVSLGSSTGQPVVVALRQADLVRGCGASGSQDCHCHLSFAGWSTSSWILGGAFLRNVRGISLDFQTGAVGIAP